MFHLLKNLEDCLQFEQKSTQTNNTDTGLLYTYHILTESNLNKNIQIFSSIIYTFPCIISKTKQKDSIHHRLKSSFP